MQASFINPLRSRKVRYWAVSLSLLAVVGLIGTTVAVGTQYLTEQTAERSFVLDLDFSRVRRILMSTDANEQIITLTGDSQFLDETWSMVGGKLGSINPLDPSWTLEMLGDLHVKTLDTYVGQSEIRLTQNVKIEPKQLVSVTELKQGSERLRGYKMVTRYLPDSQNGKTRVEQRLTQAIMTTAPWFAHAIADNRVYESASRSLVKQDTAIRKVIADYKGRWLLPIP